MNKKLLLIVCTLVLCLNYIFADEYNYLEVESIKNFSTIVFKDFNTFTNELKDRKTVFIINKDNRHFFAYKDNNTLYMVNSKGYLTIEDYVEGYNQKFRSSDAYYDSQRIGCKTSEDYYKYKESNFLSFKDYKEAKENNFLSLEDNNSIFFLPIKYPSKNAIELFIKYNKQYHENYSFPIPDNTSNSLYQLAENDNYYLTKPAYENEYHFILNENVHIENLYYFGKLIQENDPEVIRDYISSYGSEEFYLERMSNISFATYGYEAIETIDLPEIRVRTHDSTPYTVIVDLKIAFNNYLQTKTDYTSKTEEIMNLAKEYFSNKYVNELKPENEDKIRAELASFFASSSLDIYSVVDVYFIQFNIIEF